MKEKFNGAVTWLKAKLSYDDLEQSMRFGLLGLLIILVIILILNALMRR